MRTPPPPVAAVITFIDCVNRGDLDGLARCMTDDHVLQVLDEKPVATRDVNVRAWKRYFTSFPDYVIHPHRIAENGDQVAILGATTGSHLALPDEEEMKHTLIWLAVTRDGKLTRWQILEDTPQNRATHALA